MSDDSGLGGFSLYKDMIILLKRKKIKMKHAIGFTDEKPSRAFWILHVSCIDLLGHVSVRLSKKKVMRIGMWWL